MLCTSIHNTWHAATTMNKYVNCRANILSQNHDVLALGSHESERLDITDTNFTFNRQHKYKHTALSKEVINTCATNQKQFATSYQLILSNITYQ
jgi:hypothetical protein